MSTEPLRREIDGTTYQLELWDTDTALQWQHRILQLGLEPIAMLLTDAADATSVEEMPYVVLARTIAKKLDAAQVDKLIKGLLANVSIVGEHAGKEMLTRITDKATWSVHFRGRLMTAHRLAWWVLEENLADFIGAARSFVGVLQQLWQHVSKLMPADASNENGAAPQVDTTATDHSSASATTTTSS